MKYKTENNTVVYTVSRWIKIRQRKDNTSYFIYDGKRCNLSDYETLSYPVFYEDKKGNTCYLSMVQNDGTAASFRDPLLIEFSDSMEYLRLFKEGGINED